MSGTQFNNTIFKGEPAVQLSNGTIRVVVLPKRGAKIASLALLSGQPGRARPLEALALASSDRYQRPVRYGMIFEGEDGTGIDDMFPTILPCTFSDAPWSGVELPDHGEVWALPWEHTVKGHALICSVHGLRLPYSLEKTMRLSEKSLQIAYRAVNHAPFTLPFQWAAHAILDVSPGSKLIVPDGMDRIINAHPGNRLNEVGREYGFPLPTPDSDFDLSVIPERNQSGAQKYWFADRVPEGRCGLFNPRSGLTTTIRFSKQSLPYLGIWINEGGWNGYYNVGIEPSTCILDDPLSAAEHGKDSRLPPRGTLQWDLSIEVELS